MKKTKWLGIAGIALSVALCGTAAACGKNGGSSTRPGSTDDVYEDYTDSKVPGGDQFAYPGNFTEPELNVDGKADEEIWQNTPVLATFGKAGNATVKVYRGNSALFFYFDVKDTILLTEGETNDDAVTRSDSIELYLDTNADGGSMPMSDDFQLNLAIHGKTRITKGAGAPRSWGTWNGLVDYEFQLDGTRNDGTEANDVGYSVEVMIPYSELMIEKDRTIGVAFAQVDKVGLGNEVEKDWTWNGWTYDGVFVEPQTIDNYVLMSYHPDDKEHPNHLTIRDKVPMPAVTVEGTVKDERGNPVAGATATLGETGKTAQTDELGRFYFENVDSENTYTVVVEKSGFLAAQADYTREELRKANGGNVSKEFVLTSTATLTYTTLTGTVKNVVDGAVGGATVTVKNSTITTQTSADGTFSLADVPANNGAVTIVVSKTGYGDSETVIAEDMLQAGTTALGDVNLNLPWADMGTFAAKSAFFTSARTKLSRTLTGIEMQFNGSDLLSGHLEVYVDTKESGTDRGQDGTAWCFNLNDNGTITGSHFAGGAFTTEGLVWKIEHNDADGLIASFFIPYTYLGIGKFEVFGIEFGQWSTTANDWDGWTACPVGTAPVAENPTTWLRVGATNNLYRATNNASTATLSGNVGIEGINVSANGVNTATDQNGAWLMVVPVSSGETVVTFSKQGYVTKTETIEAGYFDSHFTWSKDVTLEEEKVSVSGTVTDENGATIADTTVTITVTANGEELSVTTTTTGAYTLSIGTFSDVVFKFEAEGYAPKEVERTARELSEGAPHTINASLTSTSQIRYITVSGTVTNVNGPVAGASVKVVGNSELNATTDENGAFTIANFAGVDCDLTVEKAGYLTQTLKFKQEYIGGDAYAFAEQDMPLVYKDLGGVIADKADTFAAFRGYFTRSKAGFEFRFIGSRAFTGRLELFVDTKTSAGVDARDTSDYLFNLNADGTIQIVNWGTGDKNETKPENMVLSVVNADSAPEVYFTLPYAFFGQRNADEGISPTEVIGISAGQWNGSDWDGWDHFGLPGANNEPFVKPEMPQDYIRLGAHNEVYSKADNMTVDLSSYPIHFATGNNDDRGANPAGARPVNEADDFYAKVSSRNENGVTFSFISTGDFGTRGGEKELILIYFDTGATEDSWEKVDYLVKIASDGTVYGNNASWWSASDNFKLDITATITRENGVTTVELTVPYTVLGIGANDVFGIAMREASHNAGDHFLYDPWFDCYYDGSAIDAAMSSQYVRVAADGTLYKGNHN